jgi:hypothetical protein
MIARIFVLVGLLLLVGCADDPQSCKQAGGTWNGSACSAR